MTSDKPLCYVVMLIVQQCCVSCDNVSVCFMLVDYCFFFGQALRQC